MKRFISGLIIFTLLFGVGGFVNISTLANTIDPDVVLFDDLKQGETLFLSDLSRSDNISYATSSQTNLTDRTRIFKTSIETQDLDENTYLTYYNELYMADFTLIAAVLKNPTTGKYTTEYRFETSEDGDVFSPFTDFDVFIPNMGTWNNNFWREITLRSTVGLPENTQYLRIYLPPSVATETLNNHSQLSSVSINLKFTASEKLVKLGELAATVRATLTDAHVGGLPGMYPYTEFKPLYNALTEAESFLESADSNSTYEAINTVFVELLIAFKAFEGSAIPSEKIDTCADFSKTIAQNGLQLVTSTTFADRTRFQRLSGTSGTGNYVVYEIEDNTKINNFDIDIAYSIAAGDLGDMIIQTAPAAASWSEASFTSMTPIKTAVGGISGWNFFRFTVPELPDGTKYVRVELANSGSTHTAIQVFEIKWNEISVFGISENNDYKINQKYHMEDNEKLEFEVNYMGAKETQDLWVLIAEYQANGLLINVSIEEITFAVDTPETILLDAISVDVGNRVKIMMWETTSNVPVISSIEEI